MSRCSGKLAGTYVEKKNKKYIKVSISGKAIYAHRICWAIFYGQYPDGEIDHIDGDSSNNSIKNLREVTRIGNCRNVRVGSKSKSGYGGVNWHEPTGKWRARVKIGGKEKYIGLFDSPEEANEKIKVVRAALGFHENHGSPIKTERQKQIDAIEAIIYRSECETTSAAERLYDAGARVTL
jgi:hypothetical protein